MLRRVAVAFGMLLVSAVVLLAGEIKGRITKVDADNNKITVNVDGKDQEFTLTKDTKIVGKKGDIKDGLKAKVFSNEKRLQKGIAATITTEKKGDKEVVTEVKLTGGKGKSNDQ
jgi:hypothetical protein